MYVGDLGETPLPEILATIHRYKVPGVLEVQPEDDIKRVYIANGDIIFATSTNRADSLGEMLVAAGRITMEQHRASTLLLLDKPGKRHGQVLVEMGLLTPEEMRAAVLEQVQRIVWSLFALPEGKVTFTLGNFRGDEVYKLRIATPRAVVHGCKTVPDPKRMVARLGSKGAVFGRVAAGELHAELELEPGEEQLLAMVDGRRTLYELCERGPYSPGLNARILYAFFCLGLVRVEREGTAGIKVQVPSTGGSGEHKI